MQPSSRLAALLAAPAIALLVGVPASAQSIGGNFVDNGDGGVQNAATDALAAGESAGAPGYAQGNWNNLGRWSGLIPLVGSDGVATGVTAAWDSNNVWRNGAGVAAPDAKLMQGYLDSTGAANVAPATPYNFFPGVNNDPQVYVNGVSAWLASIGAPSYSLVVYADGDGTDNRVGEYWVQAASGADLAALTVGDDLTPHLFLNDAANFSGTYDQVSAAATSLAAADTGNYLVFTGLTADSFLLRTNEAGGPTLRAPINGFQIVAVPEPATAGLLTIAGSLLLARRRRR
jgi:hypothetical protein